VRQWTHDKPIREQSGNECDSGKGKPGEVRAGPTDQKSGRERGNGARNIPREILDAGPDADLVETKNAESNSPLAVGPSPRSEEMDGSAIETVARSM
jgi:hypothetical protein